jgi:hypothetical protein
MSKIQSFQFHKKSIEEIKQTKFGANWPVVYLIEGPKEMYIGESHNFVKRTKDHLKNDERASLRKLYIVEDDEYNKSATLDIESLLIQYIAADGKYKLQNKNSGLKGHDYYDRPKYQAKFEVLWEQLRQSGLVKNDLIQIRNSDLFKYSPYKSLSNDQRDVVDEIFEKINKLDSTAFIVNGRPGTGKTIVAIYLAKFLMEHKVTKHLKLGLVVPMTSLRSTLKKVFRDVGGLSSGMVIGPSDVFKKEYDVLLVDEAHRLRRPKNLTNARAHYDKNLALGLPEKEGTELDWIMKSSKYQVLFYDKNQSVRPGDVRHQDIEKIDAHYYDLISQMRVSAGEKYVYFIEDLFDLEDVSKYSFPDYDLKLYDDPAKMVNDIKRRNQEYGLARVVAGYAWPWITRKGEEYDIKIGDFEGKWNSVAQDWVNSQNAVNEVGCIHTVQGYDLNYVGVIIGPELKYDKANNRLVVDVEQYHDRNGHQGVEDPKELERYIINIYKTLLTRGIRGTYVYVCDEGLREYFREVLVEIGQIMKEVKIEL